MPEGRTQDHPGIEPFLTEAAGVALHDLDTAVEGRIDQRVENAGGDIADDRFHIVEAHAALAAGIEGELLDLHQARPAVAPQAAHQGFAGVAVDAEIVLAQGPVDQVAKRPLVIRVAGNGQRPLRLLAERAQGIALVEVAGLHHDPRVGDGDAENGLHGGGEITGAGPDPDRPLAAEQADRARLVAQATGIGGDHVAIDPHEGEGVVHLGHEALGQGLRSLGNEAGIGPVNEDHRNARVRPAPDQPLDIPRLDRRHRPLTAWPPAPRRCGS